MMVYDILTIVPKDALKDRCVLTIVEEGVVLARFRGEATAEAIAIAVGNPIADAAEGIDIAVDKRIADAVRTQVVGVAEACATLRATPVSHAFDEAVRRQVRPVVQLAKCLGWRAAFAAQIAALDLLYPGQDPPPWAGPIDAFDVKAIRKEFRAAQEPTSDFWGSLFKLYACVAGLPELEQDGEHERLKNAAECVYWSLSVTLTNAVEAGLDVSRLLDSEGATTQPRWAACKGVAGESD